MTIFGTLNFNFKISIFIRSKVKYLEWLAQLYNYTSLEHKRQNSLFRSPTVSHNDHLTLQPFWPVYETGQMGGRYVNASYNSQMDGRCEWYHCISIPRQDCMTFVYLSFGLRFYVCISSPSFLLAHWSTFITIAAVKVLSLPYNYRGTQTTGHQLSSNPQYPALTAYF